MTGDPMADTSAERLGYIVRVTSPRTTRYIAGSNRRGTGLVATSLTSEAARFATEAEAREVARLGAEQYSGTWSVVALVPRRQPTLSADAIAERVATRRAAR